MPKLVSDKFLLHRFITDALGHLAGSYVSTAATLLIDPHDSRPDNFPHGYALVLAASFIIADLVVGRFFGNQKWFGLPSLLTASIVGYIFLPLVLAVFAAPTDLGSSFLNFASGIAGLIGLSPLFLIPALIFPLILRLMARPIVGVFRKDG